MSRFVSKPEYPIAHAITDVTGRFISVDDSFCELLHRERHEILDQTILSFTAEKHRPLNADKLDLLLKSGTSFTIRKTYLRADGGMQPVENVVSLLRNGDGSPVMAATIRSLRTVYDDKLTAGLTVARLLLRERRARAPSGFVLPDADLALLLGAYVLENEGAPIWAANLAETADGDQRANMLRIWEMVHTGVLVVDGNARSLENASIRLSPEMMCLVQDHLNNVTGS